MNVEPAQLELGRTAMHPESAPMVSIVIPCRNEEECLSRCLDSIDSNDYPKDRLEVIVVDGMSDDTTRAILEAFSSRHDYLRTIDNPRREQQVALNIAIRAARGEVIMRMDAHSTYNQDYISQCVGALRHSGADNVGGRWVIEPRHNSILGRSICFATSVYFGVGNAYYRLTEVLSQRSYLREPHWDINVAFFCCRREIFDLIGLFNENLDRSEDIDFTARLKREGFRTLFVPSIECHYLMRSRLVEFIQHMYTNGRWVLLPLLHTQGVSFSLRHIVPLLFALSLVAGFVAAIVTSPWPLALLGGGYVTVNLIYSSGIALRERDFRYLLTMPFVFAVLHVSYGLGSMSVLKYLIARRLKK